MRSFDGLHLICQHSGPTAHLGERGIKFCGCSILYLNSYALDIQPETIDQLVAMPPSLELLKNEDDGMFCLLNLFNPLPLDQTSSLVINICTRRILEAFLQASADIEQKEHCLSLNPKP